MMQFRANMLSELNKKKKYEKVIDLKNPLVPDEFLLQKAATRKMNDKESTDLDLNQACKFW